MKCYISWPTKRPELTVKGEFEVSTKVSSIGSRIDQAMDLHPRAPQVKYGRLTWLQRELATLGVQVTVETVRKWTQDEVVPRTKKLTALAQALGVDEAWLSLGQSPGGSTTTARADARGASGAVLAVAGALELAGLHVAILGNEDADLSAVIDGRVVRISVVLGKVADEVVEFTLQGKTPEHSLVGVVVTGLGSTPLLHLKAEDFQGERGRMVAALPAKALGRRKIKSVEQLG